MLAALQIQLFPLLSGQWITILRRVSASVDFTRVWNDYKTGFGDPHENFWLGEIAILLSFCSVTGSHRGLFPASGLEKIHKLTATKSLTLRVYLTDWENEMRWAQYDSFKVESESKQYTLRVSGELLCISSPSIFHSRFVSVGIVHSQATVEACVTH